MASPMAYNVAGRRAAKKALLKAAWAQGRLAGATTVHLDPTRGAPADLQQAAIDAVQQSFATGTPGHPTLPDLGHDGAVILASRSLAAWLHDDAFLSRMLAATGLTRGRPKQLNVLAAAVDEVPRYDRRLDLFGSSEGISVLRGLTHPMLSNLWEAKSPQKSIQKASLKFKLPWTYWPGNPTVTVPLANTLFANGKPHALFATKWQSDPDSAPTLTRKHEHMQQTVVLGVQDLGFTPESFSTVAGHLVPVTAPRKVVGALGNILSQLEIDGQPAPASKELESVIPRLLEQRRRLYGEDHAATGPIGVWALTIPRRYVNEGQPILEPLRLDEYRLEDELRLAKTTAEELDWLLSNRCRFTKVLSGGGGWGPKQGLLSLDPQTKLEADEDESMQTFINTFGPSENGTAKPPPRMYVQFFVEAAYPSGEGSFEPSARRWDPAENHGAVTAVLGTSGTVAGASAPPDRVSTSPGLFGAISSEGIYLSKQEGERMKSYKTTKMDAARSSVISHKRFFGPPKAIRSRALPSTERKGGIRVLDLGQEQAEHV